MDSDECIFECIVLTLRRPHTQRLKRQGAKVTHCTQAFHSMTTEGGCNPENLFQFSRVAINTGRFNTLTFLVLISRVFLEEKKHSFWNNCLGQSKSDLQPKLVFFPLLFNQQIPQPPAALRPLTFCPSYLTSFLSVLRVNMALCIMKLASCNVFSHSESHAVLMICKAERRTKNLVQVLCEHWGTHVHLVNHYRYYQKIFILRHMNMCMKCFFFFFTLDNFGLYLA